MTHHQQAGRERLTEAQKLEWNGRSYWATEFAVCMAFDAFRLCLFGQAKNFSKREVIAWIEASS